MRLPAIAVALGALSVLLSSPCWACELSGTFVGFQVAGSVDGINFVIPVLDDAQATCGDPVAVMPSPMMAQWVVGTPELALGRAYSLVLREGGTFGTHVIASAREITPIVVASQGRIPSTVGPILKPGDDRPPCTIGSWRAESLPIPLEVERAGSADIFSERDLDAIEAAASEWQSPPTSSASFVLTFYDERVDRAPDGRSTLAFVDTGSEIFESLGPENLGFTCLVCDEDGYIIEADVRLNGLDRTWTTQCDGTDFDVFGAVLHELGHVLGLAHSEDPTSVMFPITTARRLLDSRNLSRGDAEFLAVVYPCAEESCGVPSESDEACPAGQSLCQSCTRDEHCGADTDRCVTDQLTGDSICARECSFSFPCPSGFECVNTGGPSLQCVPADGRCPEPGLFVGCECESNDECGGSDDLCLSGRCASGCSLGLACPTGSACTLVIDEGGLPLGQLCVPGDDVDPCAPPPPEPNCGRCGSSDGGGWCLGLLLVGITLARRRVLVASTC